MRDITQARCAIGIRYFDKRGLLTIKGLNGIDAFDLRLKAP